jgi:hypothetical protein
MKRSAAQVGMIALLCLAGSWSHGQETGQPGPRFERLGVESCQGCHQKPSDLYREKQTTAFVALTEFATWTEHDKHSQAYKLLETELGLSICKALQIDLKDGSSSQQCLSCHADWQKGTPQPKPFDLRQGVTCEACHGAASNWANPTLHQQEEWRRRSPADKFAKHGMIDVRDPRTRARVCNSCHIGDVEQGKFVTHEMYAAGHPPLPPIEPETFADQMPKHWRSLLDKPDFEHRAVYEQLNRFRPTEHSSSRSVVLGAIESLRSSNRLFAGEVAAAKGPWPDFAIFDCTACHHELTSKSWRLERGYGGNPPGRPPMSAWPAVLVPLAIRHAATDDTDFVTRRGAFQTQLKALHAAVASRPFGDAVRVQEAVSKLDDWLENLERDTALKPFDKADVRQALQTLVAGEDRALPDFDSARQTAWAARVLATDAGLPLPKKSPPSADDLKDFRRASRQRVETVHAALAASKLNDRLSLTLPAGRDVSIPAAFPATLKSQSEYDPAWFRQTLREAIELLRSK